MDTLSTALAQLKEDWQAQGKSLDDPEWGVLVLEQYFDMGVECAELTQWNEAIEHFETGLTHAQSWLAMAQQHAGLAEKILKLYSNTGAIPIFSESYNNTFQIGENNEQKI
ncbi:hypothetical protein [Thioflexithrix psekupsensis]|uniref:Tetratricopeptide repeat protein n=1 Tax=Thioflexithrix psekupsensis TaxID=1570016 RepID=A0A251XCD0_9GAMM|nr:hypothetical protein [Thioflexithrix psekupsensis]OUD15565.1 hypothetical protein TPSD3_03325 [Thioflexithrix psekupsensis]